MKHVRIARGWRQVGACSAAIALLSAAAPPASATAPRPSSKAPSSTENEVDPRARAELARMLSYLRSLRTFTVDADVTQEVVVKDDFKVLKSFRHHVIVQRPDRLRADITGDEGNRVFFFDGKSFTVYAPGENLYGTVPAPPTIHELLADTVERYGIELPLTDVLYGAMGGGFDETILAAGDIGPSTVGLVPCEHIAVRTKAVDWQLWIERGQTTSCARP